MRTCSRSSLQACSGEAGRVPDDSDWEDVRRLKSLFNFDVRSGMTSFAVLDSADCLPSAGIRFWSSSLKLTNRTCRSLPRRMTAMRRQHFAVTSNPQHNNLPNIPSGALTFAYGALVLGYVLLLVHPSAVWASKIDRSFGDPSFALRCRELSREASTGEFNQRNPINYRLSALDRIFVYTYICV